MFDVVFLSSTAPHLFVVSTRYLISRVELTCSSYLTIRVALEIVPPSTPYCICSCRWWCRLRALTVMNNDFWKKLHGMRGTQTVVFCSRFSTTRRCRASEKIMNRDDSEEGSSIVRRIKELSRFYEIRLLPCHKHKVLTKNKIRVMKMSFALQWTPSFSFPVPVFKEKKKKK